MDTKRVFYLSVITTVIFAFIFGICNINQHILGVRDYAIYSFLSVIFGLLIVLFIFSEEKVEKSKGNYLPWLVNVYLLARPALIGLIASLTLYFILPAMAFAHIAIFLLFSTTLIGSLWAIFFAVAFYRKKEKAIIRKIVYPDEKPKNGEEDLEAGDYDSESDPGFEPLLTGHLKN